MAIDIRNRMLLAHLRNRPDWACPNGHAVAPPLNFSVAPPGGSGFGVSVSQATAHCPVCLQPASPPKKDG
jgi:hypothetical protein